MHSTQFTTNWFESIAKPCWDHLIPQLKPKKILEIGSYEGASACYLIEKLSQESEIEIHCIDTWKGGTEHKAGGTAETDMNLVESRFRQNMKIVSTNAKHKVHSFIYKEFSDQCLPRLIAEGKRNYFDFIYIDGSHLAPDVLCDAVLSFKLLKIGGIMAFDDYLWAESLPKDLLRCPKLAIDAFININFRKLNVISAPLLQIYMEKISD